MNAVLSARSVLSPSSAPAFSRRTALRGLAGALTLVAGASSRARLEGAAAQAATPAARPPLFEEWLAVWGSDPDQADTLYAVDAVLEDVSFGVIFRGNEIRSHIEDEFAGFPDHAYELLSAFSDGVRAAAEFRWTATYTGSYPGLPPGAGQGIALRGAVYLEVAEGKIVREAHYYDAYTFLLQLGVLPSPGTPQA